MARNVVVLVFRCRPLSGQPQEIDEAAAARWIDALDGGIPASWAHDGVRLIDP